MFIIDILRQVFIYIPAIVWFITALQYCSLVRRAEDKDKVRTIVKGSLIFGLIAVLYFLILYYFRYRLLEGNHRAPHWVNFILIMFAHTISLFLKTLFSKTSVYFIINTFFLIVFVVFLLLTPNTELLLKHYFSLN